MIKRFAASTALSALLLAAPAVSQTALPQTPLSQAAPSTGADQPPQATGAAATDLAKPATPTVTETSAPVWSTADGPTPKALAILAELSNAANFGLDVDPLKIPALPARFETTDERGAFDQALTKAVLAYAHQARGGRIADPSRIANSQDMKPTFAEPNAVLEALAAATDAAAALRGFHPQHTGFKNLQKALVAAREAKAPVETIQRLQVNLERWRWMPADLGAFHVWNNTPEQLTRVVKKGDVVHMERIVVGKPGHATPVTSADMKYVIFHPSWGVPNGIKTNEIGPMLKRASSQGSSFFESLGSGGGSRASSALARHQLRAYHNGKEVNPDSVDWRAVDIRQFNFTQPPSSRNVLGVVKFRFPNKFDVYMHDTQDRHLFSHPVRAYSHGCMRVQNPLKFAGIILGHDKGWSQEKVDSYVPGGRTADITLTTPVPVHITYFTASADEAGTLTVHGDIYGMDARVGGALFGKPVALAAAKTTSQPAAAPQRVARSGAAATPREGQAWNPFALSSN